MIYNCFSFSLASIPCSLFQFFSCHTKKSIISHQGWSWSVTFPVVSLIHEWLCSRRKVIKRGKNPQENLHPQTGGPSDTESQFLEVTAISRAANVAGLQHLKNLKRGKIPNLPSITILSVKSNELLFLNIGPQGEEYADYLKLITIKKKKKLYSRYFSLVNILLRMINYPSI